MRMRTKFFYWFVFPIVAFAIFSAFIYGPRKKQQSVPEGYIVDTLATGLIVPWEIVFIDSNNFIFSERNGKIRLIRNGHLLTEPLLEVDDIDTTKKMGMLGLCIHPAFATNQYVYVSYNYNKENQPFLRVVRYQLKGEQLQDPLPVIDSIFANQNHTGCRLKFGPDGKLYITTGDADRPANAQDLKSLNGKILRVNDDGTIPGDNPFVKNDTARKQIWTYGHRNPQGIDFQPATGDMYESEHGPTGGDEVNIIKKGLNYGWPVIHHQDKKDGMISPLLEFTPSIGPSEIAFYTANAFPSLKGSLLLASLRGESIFQLQIKDQQVVSHQYLLQHGYGRIRSLVVGPDGFIYFSTSQNDPPEGRFIAGYDMILRLRPSAAGNALLLKQDSAVALAKSTGKKTTDQLYQELCASCHGKALEGTERAQSMVDDQWENGPGKNDIISSIRDGLIPKGMPAWQGALTDKEIKNLAKYILRRQPVRKK